MVIASWCYKTVCAWAASLRNRAMKLNQLMCCPLTASKSLRVPQHYSTAVTQLAEWSTGFLQMTFINQDCRVICPRLGERKTGKREAAADSNLDSKTFV